MDKKDYKWRLIWSSVPDLPETFAAFEHCKVFPLFKDSRSKLVTHEEYVEMIEKEEIPPTVSYWTVGKKELGLVALNSFYMYAEDWKSIHAAKRDFIAGWKTYKNQK